MDFSLEETQKTHFSHIRVSKHDGDESWKHNRVPLPFWCFHEYTHARSHVFVEAHPECRDF